MASEIVERLNELLVNGEPVSQLSYRQLFIDICELVENNQILPQKMAQFREWLYKVQGTEDEPESKFDNGACLAAFGVFDASYIYSARDVYFQAGGFSAALRNNRRIVKAIAANPGISFNELVTVLGCEKYPDVLYMIVNALSERFLLVSGEGKDSYYWLSASACAMLGYMGDSIYD